MMLCVFVTDLVRGGGANMHAYYEDKQWENIVLYQNEKLYLLGIATASL